MKCFFIRNLASKPTGVWRELIPGWKQHISQRYAGRQALRWEGRWVTSHFTMILQKITHNDDRIPVTLPGKHCDVLCSVSPQTLITSRNKHVAHLMKVGHKCNKAAKVIRSATGHFTIAHTAHIGLWREIWWTKEVALAHLQRTRGGLIACDWIHSYTLIPAAVTVRSALSQLGEKVPVMLFDHQCVHSLQPACHLEAAMQSHHLSTTEHQ